MPMRWVFRTAARYPRQVILFFCLITLAALIRLPDLEVEITAEGMMIKNPKAMVLYEHAMETFGSENATVIYLEDEDLFEPGNLSAIQQVLRKIEAIPQVTQTSSLFSMRYIRSENGYIFSDPYLKSMPKTHQAATSLINAALMNPLVERNLLSRDGRVMAINVHFDLADYQRGFDESVVAALDDAIMPLQSRLRNVFHLGDPSIRSGITEQIRSDQGIIIPLALLVLLLTLGVMLKRFYAALIPFLTAGLSVIWTLSVMAVLDIPVNVMTSIIPALLIIVGSTEDIHLIAEYQTGIRKGFRKLKASHYMAKHMGIAILLTFVTTCLGFLSISLNRIDLLQQFGVVTAVGLTLNFLITISLLPACLQLCRADAVTAANPTVSWFTSLTLRIHQVVYRYPRSLLVGVIIVMVLSGYWATRIEVNNNVMDYFEPASPIPAQARLIQQKLSGIQSLAIILSGEEDAFLQVSKLRQLQMLQRHLDQTGLFDKSFSFADYIGVIHSGIDGEQSGRFYLPESDEVVASYMSLLGHSNAKSFVSSDYSQARIIVRHAISSSIQLNRAVADINKFAHESMDPALDIVVTGASYLNSQAVDYMADGQARSMLLMLSIIFLLITLLFRNAKIGLIAVVANLFPITALFGVMGYFKIALDTGTVMVAAIALGICVDHSMHFIVRYLRLMREGATPFAATSQVIQQESIPIFATSVALSMGFATLSLSNFPPFALFGLLSAWVMLLALVGTFIVLPLMLNHYQLDLNRFRSPKLLPRKQVKPTRPAMESERGVW